MDAVGEKCDGALPFPCDVGVVDDHVEAEEALLPHRCGKQLPSQNSGEYIAVGSARRSDLRLFRSQDAFGAPVPGAHFACSRGKSNFQIVIPNFIPAFPRRLNPHLDAVTAEQFGARQSVDDVVTDMNLKCYPLRLIPEKGNIRL